MRVLEAPASALREPSHASTAPPPREHQGQAAWGQHRAHTTAVLPSLCSHHVDVSPPPTHTSFLQPCNVPLFWWDRCSMKRSTQNPQPRERDDAFIRHFLGLLFGGLVWFVLNTCCLLHCLQHPGHRWLLHSCPPVSPDLLEPLYHASLFNLAQHRPAWIFPLSGSHKIDTMLRGSL